MLQKRVIRFIMVFVILVALIGCATPWKANVTAGYEVLGDSLRAVRDSSQVLCKDLIINPTDCSKIKTVYNKAALAYVNAGNALILAMNIEDAVTSKKFFDEYQKQLELFNSMLPDLLNLATQFGVNVGGIK